jgi:hypothetical protein
MSNSPRFRELEARLQQLRDHFLPGVFDPTGTYSDRDHDLARAYRLLAHAEMEAFMEDIAREAAISKISAWKNERKASDLLVCFLACYHSGWNVDFQEEAILFSSQPAKDSAEETVDAALRQYIYQLQQNHGIREENLKNLIFPIGVRKTDLDSTWITTLDDFGKRRGEAAHQSVGAQKAIDPKTEMQDVALLLNGLKKLDELVLELAK